MCLVGPALPSGGPWTMSPWRLVGLCLAAWSVSASHASPTIASTLCGGGRNALISGASRTLTATLHEYTIVSYRQSKPHVERTVLWQVRSRAFKGKCWQRSHRTSREPIKTTKAAGDVNIPLAYNIRSALIPYAASPVMWQNLLAGRFPFLRCVVQKEIYQNRVHLSIRVLILYFPLDELNAPYAAAYTKLV